MRTLSACKASFSLFALTQALSGCDIVQGFQSTGDNLFPEEATHLNTPGVRILPDGYRQLRFSAARELYMLGRLPDDTSSTLYSMRFSDPKPCGIANVGDYWLSQEPTRSPGPIAYYEVGRERALRFADTTCNSYAIELEDANLPAFELPRGFVVLAGGKLLVVDPQAQADPVQLVSEEVSQIIQSGFADRRIARYQGNKLKVLNQDLTEQQVFGENVQRFLRLGQQLFLEDVRSVGGTETRVISRLAVVSGKVEETIIAEDACALGVASDSFATYRQPCVGESTPFAYSEREQKTFELDVTADPRAIRLRPAQGSRGRDPTQDPFWYFYLREGNTLVVRTPTGEEHALGANAALDSAEIIETASSAHGYALVDIQGELGTLIWWSPDGTIKELAHNVLATARGLIIDYDGVAGNLAAVSGDRLVVVARRVRRDGFEFRDGAGRWTVVLQDFDGSNGQFAVFDGTLDTLFATPLEQPFVAPTLEPISEAVPAFAAWSLNHVLPGFVWFSDYDFVNNTGTLVYRNMELKFTALLNYGVSDFVFGDDEVIYSIPYGESKGVWVTLGK